LENGRWRKLVGVSRWTGDSKPSISFQRFGLHLYSKHKLDRWFLQLKSNDRRTDIWSPVRVAIATECCGQALEFSKYFVGFEGAGDYCIMFMGDAEEIWKAKMVVRGDIEMRERSAKKS
jgi:hypothetical protein